MRFLLLSILLIFIANNGVNAQIEVPFKVITKNYTTQKKESGITVRVLEGGSTVTTAVSDGSGEVRLKLPSGKKYKIEVSKAGKVTRNFSVNLTNVNDEMIQGNATPGGSIEMSLFDQQPNIDYSYVTSNVATEFYYDPAEGSELLYDKILAEKMVKKVEKLLKDADAAKGQNEAQYNALIKQADGQYNTKKYTEALASYEQALGLKPTEKYPADRINEIDGILKAEKATAQQNQQAASEYQGLISAADNLFNQKKFEEAMARYNEALGKKSEQYPKDQIVKCQTEIARLKKEAENTQKYTDAIKAADGFFGQKSFQAAKDKYKEALKWKQDDPYATGKLAEIDGKLNAQKTEQEKKKKYEDANAAGDALFDQQKWVEAKAKYNEALVIEPSSTYTLGRIKEIDAKLGDLEKEKTKQAQIAKLLTEGNTAFAASQWVPAKTKYQEVLKLDPTNASATARVAEIDGKLAADKADADKIAKIKQLVTEGDALAKQTKLPEAKAKYQEAVALKPDPAVQAKIDALDAQILATANKAEQKKQYDKAMAEGETAFAASKWEDAKAKFQQAQTIDAGQALPKQRIAEVDKKIAEGLANAQKAEKYTAAMAAGNTALAANQLPEAKTKFQEAISFDATKPEPKEKIAQIDKLLADEAAKNANKAKYDAAITAANGLLTANKLTEAKVKYQEAAALDPAQALPKQKITEIDGLLAAAEKKKQIETLLKEGDAALNKRDMAGARSKFQQVLMLDALNATASAKLQEVSSLENELADEAQQEVKFKQLKDEATALFGQAKYQESKQKLLEAKTIKTDAQVDQLMKDCDAKIAEIAKNAEQERQFNTLIADAQGLESAKQYDQAIAKYNEALKIKNDQLPKDRIAAIAKIREGNANQAKYETAIAAANTLLAANKLTEAKAKYQEAQTLDPNQLLPKQKIAEIDNALAGAAQKEARFKQLKDEATTLMSQTKYQEARQKLNETKSIKQDAQVDKLIAECDTKIAEHAASQAKIDADYAAAMKRGNDAFALKNYTDAIKAYNEALAIKPNEREPSDKAAEAQKRSIGESQTTEDAAYQKILDVGQRSIDEKNYTKAKEMYNRALGFRANDPLPKQKLAEIDALMKSEEEARKKQAAYTAKITEAEAAAKGGNLQGAITLFEQAKTIKQDETLPDNRIAELRAQLDGNNAAVQEKEKRYTEFMAGGNAAAATKDYNSAIVEYKNALNVKPKDKAAQDKIFEMQQLLDNEAKKDARNAEIQKLIVKADEKFNAEKWLDAKSVYESILAIDGSNEYAKKQVALCDQRENKRTNDQEEFEYQKILTKADENFDKKDYARAKDLYNRALSFRAKDPYPKQRLAEIENILNPKPVTAQKDPKELEALGTETDNSIVEGETKLAAAERMRKNRRFSKFTDAVNASADKTDSLSTVQEQRTSETNLALREIEANNSGLAVTSDEKQQQNSQTIAVLDTEIRNGEIVRENYETSEHLDAKSQIEVANRISEEENRALDGHSAENNELLKASKTGLENETAAQSKAAYETRLDNEGKYMQVQLKIEADAIDDTQQRLETEKIVRDASKSIIVVNDDHQQRTNQSLEAVDAEVEDVRAEIALQDYEDAKQAPLNAEELKKIETSQTELATQDSKEHLENTLTYRSYVEGVDRNLQESVEQRDDARKVNVDIIKDVNTSQEEIDRENYNALMVKTLNTNGAITTETIRQDQYAALPGKSGSENGEKIKLINDSKTEGDRVAAEGQDVKHQNTQASLNSTMQTVEANSTTGSERAAENAEVLREAKGSLGSVEQAQADKQDEKTQSTRQSLATIEKQEILPNDKGDNDLGKLYPEGVSQEQFEQNDEEGLLKAVVTRRIVVRDGHGDVYVRVQTLSGLTFTKNDQPTTEYVWQRETQDAKLKRNY